MKNKVDILSFTYSSRGRDIDIVEPVLSKLEKDLNVTVERRWLYDNFVFDILKYRPKMLIDANAIGCVNHLWACRLASMLGIKVVTFVSEGDYRYIDGSIDTMLFGWNYRQELYEDLHLEWSQRNIDYFKTNKGYDEEIVKLSGATGFDKYSLLHFMNKDDFLSKYGKSTYKKVVILAGYTFDFMFNENHSTGLIYFGEELDGIRESLYALRTDYEILVKNNPDILFIAKKHPLTMNPYYDEFSELQKYENVIVIQTEENIYDVINVSDLLVAFESTTALEAWLLGKQTLLYNPVIQEFNRSTISKGSPIITKCVELERTIHEFYDNGNISKFQELKDERDKIINNVIGYSDGKNHCRAAILIEDLFLNRPKRKIKTDVIFLCKMLLLGLRNYVRSLIVSIKCLRCIKRVNQFYQRTQNEYSDKEREHYTSIYRKAIEEKD